MAYPEGFSELLTLLYATAIDTSNNNAYVGTGVFLHTPTRSGYLDVTSLVQSQWTGQYGAATSLGGRDGALHRGRT